MEARKSNEICIKMVNETNARTPNIQIDSRVHFITWLVDFLVVDSAFDPFFQLILWIRLLQQLS